MEPESEKRRTTHHRHRPPLRFLRRKRSSVGKPSEPYPESGRRPRYHLHRLPGFSYCKSLSSVQLPDTLTGIGQHAFAYCKSLPSVFLAEGVKHIKDYAFAHCYHLQELTLPATLKSIGKAAFCSCHGLTRISIPDNAILLGSQVFADCKSLTEVKLPEGLLQLKSNSFTGCISLPSVSLPSSVVYLGNSAFERCNSFTPFLKTCSLCATEVELYTWITACGAPCTASKVRLMMCSLACVSTWTVTSSGSCLSRSGTHDWYSVSDAAGNPTSISLNPTSTNNWKNSSFSSRLIGSISAWFHHASQHCTRLAVRLH